MEEGRDLRPIGEAQRLVLDDLEELEDIWSVERNSAKDEGVQTGSQGIHICWTTPAKRG